MDPGEGPFVVETQDQSPDNPEQFEFHVDKPFVEGNEYKINIKFVSNINQGDTLARGLYLSSFPDPENGGVPSYGNMLNRIHTYMYMKFFFTLKGTWQRPNLSQQEPGKRFHVLMSHISKLRSRFQLDMILN